MSDNFTATLLLHLARYRALERMFGRHNRRGMALRCLIDTRDGATVATRFAWRK